MGESPENIKPINVVECPYVYGPKSGKYRPRAEDAPGTPFSKYQDDRNDQGYPKRLGKAWRRQARGLPQVDGKASQSRHQEYKCRGGHPALVKLKVFAMPNRKPIKKGEGKGKKKPEPKYADVMLSVRHFAFCNVDSNDVDTRQEHEWCQQER